MMKFFELIGIVVLIRNRMYVRTFVEKFLVLPYHSETASAYSPRKEQLGHYFATKIIILSLDHSNQHLRLFVNKYTCL